MKNILIFTAPFICVWAGSYLVHLTQDTWAAFAVVMTVTILFAAAFGVATVTLISIMQRRME